MKSVFLNKINTLSVVILWLLAFWSSKILWPPSIFGTSHSKENDSPPFPDHGVNMVKSVGASVWGILPRKWGIGMSSPEDPFSCPSCRLQDPHFSIFQFSRPYIHSQIMNVLKFYAPKPQNYQKCQFQSFKLGQNSIHKATFRKEIQLGQKK